MLTHPTTDRLRELGLAGMAKALEEQRRHADAADLGFEDRLAMLVEREKLERDSKRWATRLRFAGLRQQATPEDVDHRAVRGLDRTLFQKLTGGEWIERHQDLLVTGPTGTGKTWLSCALGHRACRDNHSVLYQRVPRLLEGLGIARGDGRYGRMLKSLARVQLLILDDWAITPLTAEQRRDLMEIVDDRHDRASTIVHQPSAGGALAREHRQSHHRRRRAGQIGARRTPPRTERREHAKAARRQSQA